MDRSVTVSARGLVLAAVALTAVACSSPGSASPSADAAAQHEAGATGNLPAERAAPADAHGDSGSPAGRDVQQRAVISTGEVELSSDDVATTRDRVDAVLTRAHGRVADENTLTDDRGTVTSTHLVLRVPSAAFDPTMTSLAGLATLQSSSRKAQDVTTEVIDVNARIAAQRAGVRRLRALVSRAADLPALLAVERELTARQGELESLAQQRAYLADRTSLATITVDITRHTTPSPAKRSTGGFVGGLQHGWHALVIVVVGALVGLGAMLPFAVVVALLGVPIWLVVRRVRRPRESEAPPAES
jgi:hypothetical protein